MSVIGKRTWHVLENRILANIGTTERDIWFFVFFFLQFTRLVIAQPKREPHGDLIDGEELFGDFLTYIGGCCVRLVRVTSRQNCPEATE